MVNSRMLQAELDKNSLDKEITQAELENAKRRFAEDMASVSYRTLATKPKKYKRPLKFKVKERFETFKEQLKVFLGL